MTREDEIKRAWAGYRLPWPQNDDGTPMKRLNIARQGPMPTEIWGGSPTQTTATDDRFTFELEDGYHEGQPATRVVCEGVVVNISPRRS